MIDYFNIPRSEYNTWVFYSTTSNLLTLNEWQIWQKPKNCKFIYLFLIGGGGGGGGGRTDPSNGTRTGGGGGGSAGVSKLLIPSCLVPDILYVLVGTGGDGGLANQNGTSGLATYVSIKPDTSATNVILFANAGNFGGAAGSAGTGGSLMTQANAVLNYYGVIYLLAGASGASGGSITKGGSITLNGITSGGAGGGGIGTGPSFIQSAGGDINQSIFTSTILGGVTGGGTGGSGVEVGTPSISTIMSTTPMYFTGGAGGGGNSNSLTGGTGGDGSYGSGGGGGGGCTVGGVGGRGGDGLVIITAL